MPTAPFMRTIRGATMIEALVAILILSFGLLALGSFLTYAVQLPKLSGNRSVAVVAANDLVERMRANSSATLSYVTSTFSATSTVPNSMPSGSTCSFPNCTAASLATQDVAAVDFNLKRQLPNGGITVTIPGATATVPVLTVGSVWVIWQEPGNFGTFSSGNSDICPDAVTALGLAPAPRCVYIPFRL